MATVKSDQLTNEAANPRVLNKPHAHMGRLRVAHWTHTTAAHAINDVIELVRLPAGATILEIYIANEAQAASATVDIGDSADPNRFTAAPLNVNATTEHRVGDTIAESYGHNYTAETTLQATVLGATWTAAKKFNGHVIYALD